MRLGTQSTLPRPTVTRYWIGRSLRSQRVAGAGRRKFVVIFTAPVDRFSAFGNQRRWLSDIEWLGPGLIHAITDASPLKL